MEQPRRPMPRRPCHEHEREWRGRYVDRNLADEWLERLNDLKALQLISICEGHVSNHPLRLNRMSHVNLRLKESYKSAVIQRWPSIHKALELTAEACFNRNSTYYEFELRLGTRLTPNGPQRREDFVVRVRSRVGRSTDELEPSLTNWFVETIRSIQMFDQCLIEAIHRSDTRDTP